MVRCSSRCIDIVLVVIVLTEGIYSMGGDLAPLAKLQERLAGVAVLGVAFVFILLVILGFIFKSISLAPAKRS